MFYKVLDDYESLELFSLLSDDCEYKESIEGKTARKVNPVRSKAPLSLLKKLNVGNEYYMQYKDSSGEISS